jgi:enoyl-CoA hydratase
MLSCDLAIASTSAKIGDAHLPFGQMGGGGVLTLLPRAVGPARARELIFSGRLLTPEEALDWGLVSKVVDDDQLRAAGIAFTAEVAKKSPLAVANAKSVLNAALWDGTGVHQGMRLEREVTARYCLTSEDAPEGLDAFAGKRRPHFTGR